MERKNKVITVCESEVGSFTISDYCDMINRNIESIPPEYIDSAKIIFDIEDNGEYGYISDGDYCSCRIFYEKPETDKEYKIRKKEYEYALAIRKVNKERVDKINKEREEAEKVRESKMPKITFSI